VSATQYETAESKSWPGPAEPGKVTLVTGASAGIGLAVARKLAGGGMKVVLVARRKDRLAAIAEELRSRGLTALAMPADLMHQEERERVYDEARRLWGDVDILVNNAGLGWYGYACRMPWEVAREMIEVNVAALVHLTLLCLPEMKARGSGHIINVGSIAGCLPEQGVGVYAATKAFLDSFTRSLYRELRGTGVHLSVVRAGSVATEFQQVARARQGGGTVPAEGLAVRPEQVANVVWRLVSRPTRQVFVPWYVRFATWLEPLFGRLIDRLGPMLLRRAERPADPRLGSRA
jgi:short-subunit dehydrogenase